MDRCTYALDIRHFTFSQPRLKNVQVLLEGAEVKCVKYNRVFTSVYIPFIDKVQPSS